MPLTMLSLVESLESGLIDTRTTSQRDALKSLVEGLKALAVDKILETEVNYLVDFLSARLAIADPDAVCHVLDGFLWLLRTVRPSLTPEGHLITPDQAVRICRDGLFAHLAVPSLVKRGRLRVFEILHCMLTGPQLKGLKTMQKSFLLGYIQAIDGERDPENLKLIFEMNLIVIQHFPVAEVSDDFFEIMSVYFPIDFSPPPGGGLSGVTREALASGLHRCLFASRLFAAHQLLPLLCEKADADWSQGRLDALSLLADCLHGRLVNFSGATVPASGDGVSIPLNHVSSYLVLIMPLLSKLIKGRRSRKLDSLLASCLSGLVYCYTTQTTDVRKLEDFVAVLCKSFGFKIGHLDSIPMTPDLSADALVSSLTDMIKYAGSNSTMTQLLIAYLLPHFCAPLCRELSHSTTVADQVNALLPWSQSFNVACELMDAALGDVQSANIAAESAHSDTSQQIEAVENIHRHLKILTDRLNDVLSSNLSNSIDFATPSSSVLLLVVRLYSLRLKIDFMGLGSFGPAESSGLAADVCQMILFVDRWIGVVTDVNGTLNAVRNELIRSVSSLYRNSSNCATLNSCLFSQAKAKFTGADSNLSLDILEQVACTDLTVLDFLVTFLSSSIQQDGAAPDSWSCTLRLVSVLHTVAKAALVSAPAAIIQKLHSILISCVDLFLNISLVKGPESLTVLQQLEVVFRLSTCLVDEKKQKALLHVYEATLTESCRPVPMRILSWCSILAGLRPEVVQSVQNIRSIEWLTIMSRNLQTVLELENCRSVYDYLCNVVAAAFASALNKASEPMDPITCATLHAMLRHNFGCAGDKQATTLPLLLQLWSLRSLLAHPDPSREPAIRSTVARLIPPNCENTQALVSAFPDHVNVIIDEPKSGDVPSEDCHWRSTSLIAQKTYYFVGGPLKEQIDQLTETMRLTEEAQSSVKSLRDIYLTVWLKLCLHLPPEFLVDQVKIAVRFTLLAITSSQSSATQTTGLRLLCVLSDLVGTCRDGLSKTLSSADADALFSALPLLADKVSGTHQDELCTKLNETSIPSSMEIPVPIETLRMEAQVRLSIARCLLCLHKLPPEIVHRHRDPEIMPLLARLIDDPNRAVRLAAARTLNAWLL